MHASLAGWSFFCSWAHASEAGVGFFPLKFASPVFFQGQKRLFNGQLTPLANGFDSSVKLGMKVKVSVK